MEKARILIVEDERIIAMHLESSLISLGHTVTGMVDTGEEALIKVEETRPDLVLMDIKLQGEMDGINAADQIGFLFKIPVIFLTAYSDSETLERAKISEPYAYILKPFEKRELQVVIELALYKHRASAFVERAYEELEKKVEERTRDLEILKKQKELILNSAGEGIFGLDGHGRVVFINPSATKMIGPEAKDILEGMVRDFFLGPKDHKGLFSPLQDGEIHRGEQDLMLRKKGVAFSIEYTSTPIGESFPEEMSELGKTPTKKILGCVVVFRDITSRKKATEDLHNLAKHLKISNQEMELCLRATFKNIQGPLKSIIDYSSLLDREYGPKMEGEGHELIKSIIQDGRKLRKFINGVLIYSRMDHEKKDFEMVSCQELFQKTMQHLKRTIERANARITFDRLPTLPGNPALLYHVFREFLLGSIKSHAEGNPTIHFSAEKGKDWIFCLEGKKNWPPREFREKFLKLVQYPAVIDNIGDEDLGLSLCKKIIEYHGGRLWVQPGKEDNFQIMFSLPPEGKN